MTKNVPPRTFRHTLPLTVPGQIEPGSIDLTLHVMGRKALKAWVASAKNLPDDVLLGQAIADWHDVQDEQDACVPYNAETLEALLDAYPAAAADLFVGYLKAINESRVKN